MPSKSEFKRPMNIRKQLLVLAILVLIFSFLTFITVMFFQEAQQGGLPAPAPSAGGPAVPIWLLALANAGIVLVAYGLFGLAGFGLARRLGLPGIYKEGGGWKEWLWIPLGLGLVVGAGMVAVDRLFSLGGDWQGFVHPSFPFSIIAAVTAGIGEEILFRGFVLGLWAFLLNLILRRWGKTSWALWIGSGIAALAFAASHLPSLMLLYDFPSVAAIPAVVLGELFVLNGVLGLAAGAGMFRAGLVAAIGIHLWADIVWHVIWPLLSPAA